MTAIKTVCEHCNVGLANAPRISVEMKPGPDGIPWFLCIRCWSEGRRRQDDTSAVPSIEPVNPAKNAAPAKKRARKAG